MNKIESFGMLKLACSIFGQQFLIVKNAMLSILDEAPNHELWLNCDECISCMIKQSKDGQPNDIKESYIYGFKSVRNGDKCELYVYLNPNQELFEIDHDAVSKDWIDMTYNLDTNLTQGWFKFRSEHIVNWASIIWDLSYIANRDVPTSFDDVVYN